MINVTSVLHLALSYPLFHSSLYKHTEVHLHGSAETRK